jgi:hypothetical protein
MSRNRDDERPARRSRDEEDEPRRRPARDDEDEPRSRTSRSRDDEDEAPRRGGRSGGASGYTYRERSSESVAKRAQGGGDFDKILKDGIKMWKPNDGDNNIRILPPTWKDAEHFGLDLYVNYGIGADKATYLSLSKMKGEDDPIEEERRKAQQDGDEEYAKELAPKKRVLVWLIDRDHERDGVQAWAMPQGLDRDIVKVSVDKKSGEVLQIDHPEDGYDVSFEKNGTGMKTKYEAASIARRSSPLGKDAWLQFAIDNPLPDQLNYFDYDHIARAFGGKSASKRRDRDEDDRDDDRGSSRKGRDDDDAPRSRGGRDEEPTRGRKKASDEPSWESVHEMTRTELEDLIEAEDLDIRAKDAKDDEDLADWICEDMKLKKVETSSRRRVVEDDEDDKLADIRKRRRD